MLPEGKDPSPDLLVTLCLKQLMQHRKLMVFAARAHCWLEFRTMAYSTKLFYSYVWLICWAVLALHPGFPGGLAGRMWCGPERWPCHWVCVPLCSLPAPAGSRGNLHTHQLQQPLTSAAGLGALWWQLDMTAVTCWGAWSQAWNQTKCSGCSHSVDKNTHKSLVLHWAFSAAGSFVSRLTQKCELVSERF